MTEKKRTRPAGAGRKQKYGEPTTTIAFRVPLSKVDEIKRIVKTELDNQTLK